MIILFPSDPLKPYLPDEVYTPEKDAAESFGFTFKVVNVEALNLGDAQAAVKRVGRVDEPELAVYRGWMLSPQEYKLLATTLAAQGIVLINSPQEYRHCHYLPESYPLMQGRTPESVWLPLCEGVTADDLSFDEIMRLLEVFQGKPVILKDYVKSRKHE